MKPKSHYRIRGLQSQSAPIPTPHPSQQTSSVLPIIRAALGVPTLDDYVAIAPLERLSEYFPGHQFFATAGRRFRPIKPHPTALAKYILAPELPANAPLSEALAYHRYQQQLTKEIELITDVDTLIRNDIDSLTAIQSPIGCALALALYHRFDWPGTLRQECIHVASGDPVGAFLLASCAFPKMTRDLLETIKPYPRLIWALTEIPGLRRHLPNQLLLDWCEEDSPYIELIRHNLDPLKFSDQDVVHSLYARAGQSPMAAALCYGLTPEDSHRNGWLATMEKHPFAALMAGRVLDLRGKAIPHSATLKPLCEIACDEGKFHYHWFRDVEYLFATESIIHMWPGPWACEMIDDFSISPDQWQFALGDLDEADPLTPHIRTWALMREKE